MIHATQMQQPMQQQHTHLIAQSMPVLPSLPPGHIQRNRQIPRKSVARKFLCRRKAQHIRRRVLCL